MSTACVVHMLLLQEVAQLSAQSVQEAVFTVNAGSDPRAMKKIMDELRAVIV